MCMYCSKYITREAREKCVAQADPNWNGRCAYEDGPLTMTLEQADADRSVLCINCTKGGCTMTQWAHAVWNGLCAYQGGSQDG